MITGGDGRESEDKGGHTSMALPMTLKKLISIKDSFLTIFWDGDNLAMQTNTTIIPPTKIIIKLILIHFEETEAVNIPNVRAIEIKIIASKAGLRIDKHLNDINNNIITLTFIIK